ncbi:MBL fold metallo-hydrolase [Actinomadura sp. NPDC047616]|uniref:MBL fold metallo-hydrolase n=1 Tax=Actinomadura sp. NPDC047616 TaxID=3155914 RepID=UPI0033D58926
MLEQVLKDALPPRGWLPDTTDEVWTAHPDYLDDSGHLVASIGGLLVENGDRALLIDAGFGPQSLPPDPGTPRGAIHGGALLDNLAELGRRPEEIESVASTHLHPDHIGWAWHPAPGGDHPAFVHADHLVSAPEWAQRDLLETHGMTTSPTWCSGRSGGTATAPPGAPSTPDPAGGPVTTTIACGLPTTSRTGYWPGIVAAAPTATATTMPGFTVEAPAPATEQDPRTSPVPPPGR